MINQVLVDPQILWRGYFFSELSKLPEEEKSIVLQWFNQMNELQGHYISEIERANNLLKMWVCQGYEGLHTSDRIKEDFISKINHIENRIYFQKKSRSILSTEQVAAPARVVPKPTTKAPTTDRGFLTTISSSKSPAVAPVPTGLPQPASPVAEEPEKEIESISHKRVEPDGSSFFDRISTSCETTISSFG